MSDREDLIVACAIGDLAWLKRCLKDGFRPEEPNSEGANALHSAAKHGRLECLRYLLDHTSIDVNCPVNKTGITALQLVVSQNSGTRCLQCVRLLLDKGAHASSQDHSGSTALHKAASIGYAKCLKLLLEAKADIHHKNKEGQTALDMARLSGHYECARLLQALQWCSNKDEKLREKLRLDDYLAEKDLKDKTINTLNKRHKATKAFEDWLSIKQIPISARQDPGACGFRLESRLSHNSTCSCEGCSGSSHASSTSNRSLTHSTKLSYNQAHSKLKSVGKPGKMYPYTNYPEKAYRTHEPRNKSKNAGNDCSRGNKSVHFRCKTFPQMNLNGKTAATGESRTPGHSTAATTANHLNGDRNCDAALTTDTGSNDDVQKFQSKETSDTENEPSVKPDKQENNVLDEKGLMEDIQTVEQSSVDNGDPDDFTFHEVGPVNDLQSVSANVSSPTIIQLLQTQTLQQVNQATTAPVRSVSHSQINHRHNAYRGKLHRRVSLGSIPEGRIVTDYSCEMDDDHALQDAIIRELLLAQQQMKEVRNNFNDTTGWNSDGSESEDGGSSTGSSEAGSDDEEWAESSYNRKDRLPRPKGAFATRSTPLLSKNLSDSMSAKRPSSVGSTKMSSRLSNKTKYSPPSLAILNLAWQPETLSRPLTPRMPKDKKPQVVLWSRNAGNRRSLQQTLIKKDDDLFPPAIPNNSPVHQEKSNAVKDRPHLLTVPISTASNDSGCHSPLSSKSTVSLQDSMSNKNTDMKVSRRRTKSATLSHKNTIVLKPTVLKFGGELKPMYA